MQNLLIRQLLCLALLAAAGSSHAVLIFQATLTSDQETPALPFEGSSGFAKFVLSDDGKSLSYDVRLFGLDLRGVDPATGIPGPVPGEPPGPTNDNLTRLHIHKAPFGFAGGIVFGMIDASVSLRNDKDDLFIDVPGAHATGVWDGTEGNGTTLLGELSALLEGRLYINVHTADHGAGEIRGQILAVPEPGSLALLGIGALGLLGAGLRRHRR